MAGGGHVLQAGGAGPGELRVPGLQPLQDSLQAGHQGGGLIRVGHGASVVLGGFYASPGAEDPPGRLGPPHGPQHPMTRPVNMGRVTVADLSVHIPCGNPRSGQGVVRAVEFQQLHRLTPLGDERHPHPLRGAVGGDEHVLAHKGCVQVVHDEGKAGPGPDQLRDRAVHIVDHARDAVQVVLVVRRPEVQDLDVGLAGQRRGDGKAEVVVAHETRWPGANHMLLNG